MALTKADVYSLQAPGLATVLGSGLAPLRIIQQENLRRAREAALRAKQQADLEKQFTPPTPDTDGGQLFAPEVAQSAKNVLEYGQQQYRKAVNGEISVNDARALVAARNAEHGVLAKRAKEQDAAVAEFRKNAAANNLDPSKVGDYINRITSDPTTGERMKSGLFDVESLNEGKTNSELLNKAKVVQTFLKGLAQKQETDYATAARQGGTGITRSTASNIFASDAQGRPIYTQDAQGNAVPKIANLQALEQAALQDPQMAALLRGELQRGQRSTASSLMGLAPEHVSDDQLEALNAQTDQSTPHERQALADVLRGYGTLVQKEKETYRAPARPAGGATPSYVLNPATYEPGVTGGASAPTQTPFSTFFNAPELAIPSQQNGFYSPAKRPQPTYATKTNPVKQFEFKGLPANEVLQPGPDGSLTHVRNNNQPIFGVAGEGVTLLRNTKTGELRHGPDNQAAFEQQLHQLGPDWKMEPGVQVAVPKNKNYAAESAQVMARLQAREAARAESQDGYVPKTPDQLEKEAFDLASGGTVQTYVPYNRATRGSIDAQTKGAYREYGEKILPEAERRIRAGKPRQTPPRPSFLPTKTSTTSTTRTANPAARAGGML